MKTDTLIILAAAVGGVYAVYKLTARARSGGGTAGTLNNNGNVNATVAAAVYNSALPGQEGWGWQYYSDGTAIGPDGSYYLNGTKVWSP